MAEEAAAETTIVETEKDNSSAAVQEMDLETPNTDEIPAVNGGKREREEEEETNESAENGGEAKKHKVDDDEEEKSVEEQRVEKEESKSGPVTNESPENGGESKTPEVVEEEKIVEEQTVEKEELKSDPVNNESSENGGESKIDEQMVEKEAAKIGPVSVGYKSFETSVEMFDYFFKFLRFWPPNMNVNKYEHTMLLELLKKGHLEPDKKIGSGIRAFQVRYHPQWKSRCFFLVREDNSSDDFSFRKCVDHILPLPENMQIKSDGNEGGGRGGRGGGRGGWRGGGRGRGGGKPRN